MEMKCVEVEVTDEVRARCPQKDTGNIVGAYDVVTEKGVKVYVYIDSSAFKDKTPEQLEQVRKHAAQLSWNLGVKEEMRRRGLVT